MTVTGKIRKVEMRDRSVQDRQSVDHACAPGHASNSASAAEPAYEPSVLAPWTLDPEQLAAHIVLNVHVPVATVLDLSREPGTLDGYGPVSAEHVRLVRPGSWRRVLVEATSGRPIALDDRLTPVDPDPERAREQVRAGLAPEVVADIAEPEHDPSARLARLVDLGDVRCCGPGAPPPAPTGTTWSRTPTADVRRQPRTAQSRCHRAKHAGWVLVRHPDGSTTWTSPIRRVYDRPSPHAAPPHVDLDQELPPLRPGARPRQELHPDDDPPPF